MLLEVKTKLRRIYSVNYSKHSVLNKFNPDELNYALCEGLVELKTKRTTPRYCITRKGIDFIEHSEYSEADLEMLLRTVEKFKICWNSDDFTQLTKNQRNDMKRFGLIGVRFAGMYMPTVEGCKFLGITQEEAQEKYTAHIQKTMTLHPRTYPFRKDLKSRSITSS